MVFLACLHLMNTSCMDAQRKDEHNISKDSFPENPPVSDTLPQLISNKKINTTGADAEAIVGFAKTLIGIPYKYGSTDPSVGFDCSGFITYVFNHFDIHVPRSSVHFTQVGVEIPLSEARPGDLILFTGTDNTIRTVGHMGIVTESGDTLKFIHSTSGKIYGVTITPLNDYYKGRFMKITRIFSDR